MHFDKKTLRFLLEFIFIFTIFVLPPMLNKRDFTPPPQPEGFFYVLVFISKIVFFAAYEEILYRIYLPYRIKSFYGENPESFKSAFAAYEILPVIFFALAHRYLGPFNVLYAAAAGIISYTKKSLYKMQHNNSKYKSGSLRYSASLCP